MHMESRLRSPTPPVGSSLHVAAPESYVSTVAAIRARYVRESVRGSEDTSWGEQVRVREDEASQASIR